MEGYFRDIAKQMKGDIRSTFASENYGIVVFNGIKYFCCLDSKDFFSFVYAYEGHKIYQIKFNDVDIVPSHDKLNEVSKDDDGYAFHCTDKRNETMWHHETNIRWYLATESLCVKLENKAQYIALSQVHVPFPLSTDTTYTMEEWGKVRRLTGSDDHDDHRYEIRHMKGESVQDGIKRRTQRLFDYITSHEKQSLLSTVKKDIATIHRILDEELERYRTAHNIHDGDYEDRQDYQDYQDYQDFHIEDVNHTDKNNHRSYPDIETTSNTDTVHSPREDPQNDSADQLLETPHYHDTSLQDDDEDEKEAERKEMERYRTEWREKRQFERLHLVPSESTAYVPPLANPLATDSHFTAGHALSRLEVLVRQLTSRV